MSELINTQNTERGFRWHLLTTVSALALFASVALPDAKAADEDADRPTVWIELGGQLSRLEDSQETFTAPFETERPSIFSPSEKFEHPPLYSIDEIGKISFQPENSDWIFSASIRYGRSTSDKHVHQQTYPVIMMFPSVLVRKTQSPYAAHFANTQSRNIEQHAILDFTAGKDVGLGLLGSTEGSSTLNLGVRIAQFRSKSNIALKSDPDWHFQHKVFEFSYYSYQYQFNYVVQPYHSNAASFLANRSFHGVGPSLSWNASMPFVGNPKDGELTLDWGLNAALLFGRQKTQTQHQRTERYNDGGAFFTAAFGSGHGVAVIVAHTAPPASIRLHSVMVPNVGGFAGLSFQYADAKISAGYRADLFFGAMDGGIDTRKRENVGFFGPFASVSVDIGG